MNELTFIMDPEEMNGEQCQEWISEFVYFPTDECFMCICEGMEVEDLRKTIYQQQDFVQSRIIDQLEK